MRLFLQKSRLSLLSPFLKYALLPLMIAIYPAVFHYANNTRLVLLSSFIELCVFLAGFGLVIYISLGLFSGRKFPQSAVGTLLVLAFFYTYGFVFAWLRFLDVFQVETYNFLPFWIFAALYLAWIITGLDSKVSNQIWNVSLFVFGVLVTFNLAKIIPEEIEKNKGISGAANNSAPENNTVIANQQSPDIYYLIFDEAAGFEVIRQHWQYNEVDEFAAFLKSNGFYVAENSHGHSTGTLYELRTRLNYQEYPRIGGGSDEYYDMYNLNIRNNLVMAYLKTHGYTLIAYTQTRLYLPTLSPVPVDYLVEKSPEEFIAGDIIPMDDYKTLVLENTLLRSYIKQSGQDPLVTGHKNMILYTVKNVASTQFSSPKFVYVHLLLPHVPFVFKENGDFQLEGGLANWQKYLENYKFSLLIAQRMIENILAASDPDNPPVIILQSDHGARNIRDYPYTGYLEDYPDEGKTWIVNALYLPGCEDAPLTQNMNPIDTFPIVFNCYFDANIPLQ